MNWIWSDPTPGDQLASLDRPALFRRFWRLNRHVLPNERRRNEAIVAAHRGGATPQQLARQYGLRDATVRRIVAQGDIAA